MRLQPASKATFASASVTGRRVGQSCFYILSLLLAQAYLSPALGESLSTGDGDLRVMTYNANEGTDFLEVQQATNSFEFLVAVGQTITQVRSTNPPERMQALAKQIIKASPALVGVQELDQWATGSFDPTTSSCGPTTLEFDMSRFLRSALVGFPRPRNSVLRYLRTVRGSICSSRAAAVKLAPVRRILARTWSERVWVSRLFPRFPLPFRIELASSGCILV